MKKIDGTSPKRNRFTNLEQVARLLLKRLISFTYTPACIVVTDSDKSEMAFYTATYDFETKEVVLMMGASYIAEKHYIEIKHSDAVLYIERAK